MDMEAYSDSSDPSLEFESRPRKRFFCDHCKVFLSKSAYIVTKRNFLTEIAIVGSLMKISPAVTHLRFQASHRMSLSWMKEMTWIGIMIMKAGHSLVNS